MPTGGAQEIKKQEALVRFSIISYKTRFRVLPRSNFYQVRCSHNVYTYQAFKISGKFLLKLKTTK